MVPLYYKTNLKASDNLKQNRTIYKHRLGKAASLSVAQS